MGEEDSLHLSYYCGAWRRGQSPLLGERERGSHLLSHVSCYHNLITSIDDDAGPRPGTGHPARPSRRDAVCGRHGTLGEVRRSADRGDARTPHGLRYSLTLHAPDGASLVGFDNAHPVRERPGPGRRRRAERNHRHRLRKIRPYEYKDAVTLLEDFWKEVDQVLGEGGSIP